MTHYHFIVWAAEGRTNEGYSGVTYIDLTAETPDLETIIARARAICPGRQFYWVNNVVEHHDHAEATVFAPGRNGKS